MSRKPHPRKPGRKNKPVVKNSGITRTLTGNGWRYIHNGKPVPTGMIEKLSYEELKKIPQHTDKVQIKDKPHFGGDSKTGTVTWFTPKPFIKLIGPFDLDPCSHITRPYPIARKHYTIEDNGLVKKWKGLVFCNPPYDDIATWLSLCAAHKSAVALVFNRTETDWFFDEVWGKAFAVNFIRKRIKFCGPDGKPAAAGPGAGSVLIAYDSQTANRIKNVPGQFIQLKNIFSNKSLNV